MEAPPHTTALVFIEACHHKGYVGIFFGGGRVFDVETPSHATTLVVIEACRDMGSVWQKIYGSQSGEDCFSFVRLCCYHG